MRVALYQPDQAGNVGAVLRLGACLDVGVDVVRPCGFPVSEQSLRSDRELKRSAMDYVADVSVHDDWAAFRAVNVGRIVLLTTKGDTTIHDFAFEAGDTLLMGSESAGVPTSVRAETDAAVRIPIADGARSLNLAVAAGIALGEALRRTGGWPR
ncbi:MAG: tRNA (cytidine(34)-2'-O)-methyltransferase [uncultured Sphingomonadaceae bacterium]|uniref:tRNA (cytidine(34)-2'-O)-methyltransferase n=1 Tax=uncultured Sphingomonadaceae bacterium TaxID=169976 RepID=A0A6J4THF7_9SPHN|nr:MAG: tRNA (cytidine(34)-2'-O)-methyltransferase [uncultured Sphingomonadaceae bacterium]